MKYKDEIIEEVWKNRDAYVEKRHHSLKEILADIKRRQKKAGARIVDRRQKPGKQTHSSNIR